MHGISAREPARPRRDPGALGSTVPETATRAAGRAAPLAAHACGPRRAPPGLRRTALRDLRQDPRQGDPRQDPRQGDPRQGDPRRAPAGAPRQRRLSLRSPNLLELARGLSLGILLTLTVSACVRRVEVPPELQDPGSCPTFAAPDTLGTITDPRLDELSGVVLSRRQPGVLWAHNDSGAGPTLYALDSEGELLAEVELEGAEAVDWEDIALGPGPEAGVDYLYVGDIGDNRRRRSSVTIYRLAEPDVREGSGTLRRRAEPLLLHYDKRPANAEALLVDPEDGTIYVLTKDGGAAALYREEGGVLRYVQAVDAGEEALVTAADISADGRRIALRTYNRGYLWRRGPGESIADALGRPPCPIGVAEEPQGEAIALDPAAPRLITLSESRDQGGGGVPIHSLAFTEPEG